MPLVIGEEPGWRLWWPSDWRGGGARERRGHQRLAKF